MASLLPNLPPSSARLTLSNPSHQKLCACTPHSYPASHPLSPSLISSSSSATPFPSPCSADHDNRPINREDNDFHLNLGYAVRSLREDLPNLFSRDLDFTIYRDDVTFVDPLNTFRGIDNYRLIFRALRFHGRMLFREIDVEVTRVWQPSDRVILVRWDLRGVPRVPWEAEGRFGGASWYKLDRRGRIYEHKVDNLALDFPRMAVMGPASVVELAAASSVACPSLGNLWGECGDWGSSSWLEFYRAVKGTLAREACSCPLMACS
ncbi:hypothetical protein QJS04_geneDACA014890 [Acorus gramineus]|uniref:Uncharacterized protein n=1 Tax=Acorus gramineus TaxID=55184 RepID=A0AAV9BWM0_ACOGR|nr:hypothetical protein QJS04_geneDACA014890 [Acorus gramineus]